MKVTEVKFTRRYNVGQYEHEEYAVVANLEDDEKASEVLTELKAEVQAAYSGEAGAGEPGQDEGEEQEDPKPAKTSKKSNPKPTTARGAEPEDSEEDGPEAEEEDTEDAAEVDGEDEEEDPPAKKPAAKKTPSSAGAKDSKKFKKKPQAYLRTNETHKDLFSTVLRKVAPNWKKSFESKAHAKTVSKKMEGKEFLDETGKVLASFEAEVKKAMGKFK